jgi:hypothetical protein
MNKKLSFMELKKDFKNGRPECNPAVMWFWNDCINEHEISYQLEKFKEKSIFEFFIHPMYGLKVDYLSNRYFQLIRHAVDEAKRLSMKFWIYDEYNWPSGSAGGYLLKDEPWTRSVVLRMADAEVAAGSEIRLVIAGANASLSSDDGKVHKLSETNTEVIFACVEHNGEMRDIYGDIKFEEQDELLTAVWHNVSSEPCHMMIFYTERSMMVLSSASWSEFNWNQPGYLDVCNKEAVKKFIEYTHERYKEAVGDEFGKTVRGIFTDEVTACVPHAPDTVSRLMPWSKNFAVEFEKRRGYEIKGILPALFMDITDDKTMMARHDYWRTVSELYVESYMKLTSEWCKQNNLIYTGHFGGEEMMLWNLTEFGDIYNALSYLEIPGLDSILSYQYINDYSFNIAGKLVASAAYFQGKELSLFQTQILDKIHIRVPHPPLLPELCFQIRQVLPQKLHNHLSYQYLLSVEFLNPYPVPRYYTAN